MPKRRNYVLRSSTVLNNVAWLSKYSFTCFVSEATKLGWSSYTQYRCMMEVRCLSCTYLSNIPLCIYGVLTRGWMVWGSNPGGGEIFRTSPDRPWAHPASCTMGTVSFQGVEIGRGVTLNPHPLLVPRSKTE
jgi:hypothetical protein